MYSLVLKNICTLIYIHEYSYVKKTFYCFFSFFHFYIVINPISCACWFRARRIRDGRPCWSAVLQPSNARPLSAFHHGTRRKTHMSRGERASAPRSECALCHMMVAVAFCGFSPCCFLVPNSLFFSFFHLASLSSYSPFTNVMVDFELICIFFYSAGESCLDVITSVRRMMVSSLLSQTYFSLPLFIIVTGILEYCLRCSSGRLGPRVQ